MTFRKIDRTWYYDVLFLTLSSLFLSIPALINGFPFLFPDSGDYLVFTPQLHRSPFYGILIFMIHMNRWLWPVVFFQGALATYVIMLFLRTVVQIDGYKNFTLVILTLGLVSSLPFFTGFIMADIFTPLLLLTILIAIFGWNILVTPEKYFVFFLLCVALTVHVTHFMLGMTFIGVCYAAVFGFKIREYINKTTLLTLLLALALGFTAIISYNGIILKSYSLSPAGKSFIVAGLIERGPVVDFLKSHCEKNQFKLCAHVNEMPLDANKYLWDNDGIFKSLGSFKGMKEESAEVLSGTIQYEPFSVIIVFISNFFEGLITQANGAEFFSHLSKVPSMTDLIEKKFGTKARTAYVDSLESQNKFPQTFTKQLGYVGLCISIIVCVIGLIKVNDKNLKIVIALLFMGVLMNDFLCSAFSSISDRYQTRVSWLIILSAITLILRHCLQMRGGNSGKILD